MAQHFKRILGERLCLPAASHAGASVPERPWCPEEPSGVGVAAVFGGARLWAGGLRPPAAGAIQQGHQDAKRQDQECRDSW